MLTPTVRELCGRLEPVARDTFLDGTARRRAPAEAALRTTYRPEPVAAPCVVEVQRGSRAAARSAGR
jgi:hypothetical protein